MTILQLGFYGVYYYCIVQQQKKCGFKKADIGANCSSYKRVKNGSESDLLVAVATVGPIAVAMDATHSGFVVSAEVYSYDIRCLNVECLLSLLYEYFSFTSKVCIMNQSVVLSL